MAGEGFKENKLFRNGPDGHRNACVGDNGGPYDLFDYAHGYFDATRWLLKASKSDRIAIDTLIYPLCFNFRHSVELFTKYLANDLALIAGEASGFKLGHEMLPNWKAALDLALKTSFKFPDPEKAFIQQIIDDLCEVDPRGQIFRYPESIKGDQHLKEWSVINLDVLEIYIEGTLKIFTEWHYLLEAKKELYWESLSEA